MYSMYSMYTMYTYWLADDDDDDDSLVDDDGDAQVKQVKTGIEQVWSIHVSVSVSYRYIRYLLLLYHNSTLP